MSYTYIQAKINDLSYKNDYLQPYGYFIGERTDSKYLIIPGLTPVDEYETELTWYLVEKTNAFPYFELSGGQGDTLHRLEWDYNGQPAYGGQDYLLYSSIYAGEYIVTTFYHEHEPVFSIDLLSGGLSGDYYYRTGVTSVGYYMEADQYDLRDAPTPIECQISGAVPSDVPQKLILKAKWNRWKYAGEQGDDAPAGKFVNEDTGAELYVGMRSYQCQEDNTIWVGYGLSSKNAYWQEEKGLSFKLRHLSAFGDWGEGWYAGNLSGEAWVYPNGLSVIDAGSFTVQNYQYNSEKEKLIHIPANDLHFLKGPWRLGTTIGNIYMGEVSLWR